MKVWCVRHRDGFCALKPLRRRLTPAPAYNDNEKTQCDHYITFPGGYAFRAPDCAECSAVLEKKR